MSSTSRRRIGFAVLAITLGPLTGISPATSVGASGKPSPAQLAFNLTTYDYGSVTVGQEPTSTFTLSNPGGKSASSLRVILSGAELSITTNGCGKLLRPSATCDVIVAFAPEGDGAASGTLTASARGTLPAIVTLTGTGVAASADRYLYWGETNIGRAQLDGASADPAFVVDTYPSALDVGAGYIYWVYSGSVLRIPVDGTGGPQSVYVGDPAETHGVAVADPYVYWANYTEKEIWRANLDGGDPQLVLIGLVNPWGIDVDGGYLYWSQEGVGASTSKILRVPLSNLASAPETLFEYPATTTSSPAGLEVGNGRVYWADTDWSNYAGSVLSVPVGGGEAPRVEVALSAPNRIDDVALDTDGGWLYYTVNFDDAASNYDSSIARQLLAGSSDAQTVVSGIWMAYALAIG